MAGRVQEQAPKPENLLLRKSLGADRIAYQSWGQTQTIACQILLRLRR